MFRQNIRLENNFIVHATKKTIFYFSYSSLLVVSRVVSKGRLHITQPIFWYSPLCNHPLSSGVGQTPPPLSDSNIT